MISGNFLQSDAPFEHQLVIGTSDRLNSGVKSGSHEAASSFVRQSARM